jgi:hypothetical protein
MTATENSRDHAGFHLREDGAGVGVAVARAMFKHGERVWDCVVRDAREWHYIRVIGIDVGPFSSISTEDIEQGIERFAATFPRANRLSSLVNANPLHIDRDGTVHD